MRSSSKAPVSYHAVPFEMDLKELDFAESATPILPNHHRQVEEKKHMKIKFVASAVLLVSGLALLAIASLASTNYFSLPISLSTDNGEFDDQGRYILRNFDLARPMSNFLPGLGGIWGVPMWAFYVNRGQGITSFGKLSKDGAIAKFVTAEKAYQQTPFTGFRTFLKGKRVSGNFEHMPFFPRIPGADTPIVERNMLVGSNDLIIEETAPELGLKTSINYLIASEQDFPALIRKVTFTNLDAYLDLDLEVLDGLGRLVPNGLSNNNIDAMGRTMEAWMNVYNTGSAAFTGDHVTLPFFHISQDTGDTAQVQIVKDGYFSLAFVDGDDVEPGPDGLRPLLPFIVDPSIVYALDTTLTYPANFFSNHLDTTTSLDGSSTSTSTSTTQKAHTVEDLLTSRQGTTSRTPCAFAGGRFTVKAGQSLTITSVYGYAEDLETLVGVYAPQLRQPTYTATKVNAGQTIVQDILRKVTTKTASAVFDAYVQQDYLDNVLRGGMPLALGQKDPKIFHVYSRVHGDIERDYNYFVLDTTYFSQGPGNFRDVNQNRRLDCFTAPFVGDFNLQLFLSLVQSDGFNPFNVGSTVFRVPMDRLEQVLDALQIIADTPTSTTTSTTTATTNKASSRDRVRYILTQAFRPGQFFVDCKRVQVQFALSREDVVNVLMDASVQDFAAKFDQNGFWVDHWTYTLDLLDNYLSIFPDQETHVLWDANPVPFFMSPAVVKPRATRYVLKPNPNAPANNHNDPANPTPRPGDFLVRSYNAISVWGQEDFPQARIDAMNHIFQDPLHYILDNKGFGGVWQRAALPRPAGAGTPEEVYPVFTVSPIAKVLMLGVLKFGSLDPYGMGVEMEGGKPGWNDAMNGLPGLLGSGMPETYEMLRILRFVHRILRKTPRAIVVPHEFVQYLQELDDALAVYETASSASVAVSEEQREATEFQYWDATNTAREHYRAQVVATFSGEVHALAAESYLVPLLTRMIARVDRGIARALRSTSSGLSPTYFYYDCTNFTTQSNPVQPGGAPWITARAFVQHSLPLFLEGPTRQLKILDSVEARRAVYAGVRGSALYDTALQMYTISESLASMGQDVGRMKAFSAGWLENQSVWLHMSYKFYLELLRGGLYEEFFQEIRTGLVPFMDHVRYGRSPLEAASFVVSSAFPDASLHGVSFLARLSGSTAEFLSMWAYMMAGAAPFGVVHDAETGAEVLSLQLRPVLPAWLFTPDTHEVSFTFLGHLLVTYVHPRQVDTWRMETPPQRIEITYYPEGVHQGVSPEVEVVDSGVLTGVRAEAVRSGRVQALRVYLS